MHSFSDSDGDSLTPFGLTQAVEIGDVVRVDLEVSSNGRPSTNHIFFVFLKHVYVIIPNCVNRCVCVSVCVFWCWLLVFLCVCVCVCRYVMNERLTSSSSSSVLFFPPFLLSPPNTVCSLLCCSALLLCSAVLCCAVLCCAVLM